MIFMYCPDHEERRDGWPCKCCRGAGVVADLGEAVDVAYDRAVDERNEVG